MSWIIKIGSSGLWSLYPYLEAMVVRVMSGYDEIPNNIRDSHIEECILAFYKLNFVTDFILISILI